MGIRLVIKFHQGSTAVVKSPEQIRVLGRLLMRNVYVQMGTVAEKLTVKLMAAYAAHARDRLIGQPLAERLQQALYGEVEYVYGGGTTDAPPVRLQYFDLALMRRLTSTPEDKIGEPGWFNLFEDGGQDREHGSSKFGFAPLGFAIKTASELSKVEGMGKDERAQFLSRIAVAFRGKHGQGIMVELDKPLFFEFPDGPTAEEAGVIGHPGFEHWNIWRTQLHGADAIASMRNGTHPIAVAVKKAIDMTASQAAAYFGRGGMGYIPGVRMGGT